MMGWKGWALLKLEMNDTCTPPGASTRPEIFSTCRGEEGPTFCIQLFRLVMGVSNWLSP